MYSVACIGGRQGVALRLGRFARQCSQQGLRLLKIRGVKALGEPAVDLRQKLVGSAALPLMLPQAPQVDSSPEFQRLGLLASSNGQRLEKTRFRGFWQDPGVV
jgi:hypothetical protein